LAALGYSQEGTKPNSTIQERRFVPCCCFDDLAEVWAQLVRRELFARTIALSYDRLVMDFVDGEQLVLTILMG
jgi:hypothetical protein